MHHTDTPSVPTDLIAAGIELVPAPVLVATFQGLLHDQSSDDFQPFKFGEIDSVAQKPLLKFGQWISVIQTAGDFRGITVTILIVGIGIGQTFDVHDDELRLP